MAHIHNHMHTYNHTHIHTQSCTHYFLPTHKCTLSYAHWQTHTLTQEPHLCFLPLIAPFPVLHKILTEQGDRGAPSLLKYTPAPNSKLNSEPDSSASCPITRLFISGAPQTSSLINAHFTDGGNFHHHNDISGRVAFHLWITKDSFHILSRSRRKSHPCSSHPEVLERGGGGTWGLGYSDVGPISQLGKMTGWMGGVCTSVTGPWNPQGREGGMGKPQNMTSNSDNHQSYCGDTSSYVRSTVPL